MVTVVVSLRSALARSSKPSTASGIVRRQPTAATPWRWDEVERGEARHLLLDEAVVHHSTHADVLDPLG